MDAHRREVEAWRRLRNALLREPMSWVSLVGLEWLGEGENVLGSRRDADLRLPTGPAVAGRLVRDGARVVGHAEHEALRSAGEAVHGLELVSDADAADGEEPTLLDLGSLRMVVIRRGERIGLRVWDTESPALRRFSGIPHYPVDVRWRFVGRLQTPEPGATVDVPNVLGEASAEPLAGRVTFEGGGVAHRLSAIHGDDGLPWLIFADETNGETTYGGGRFLYTTRPAADGSVVVDFNRAYNPPCVFSPFATCPLPPGENRLPIRVEAGEKLWRPTAPTR